MRKKSVVAVCPIVGGKSLKGPSDKMLEELGYEASALGVAKLYADFTGTFVIDPADKAQSGSIRSQGMKVEIVPTVMTSRTDKRKLARSLLALKI
jgi:LPPG:FO 2-phospho-L-lactate transferase